MTCCHFCPFSRLFRHTCLFLFTSARTVRFFYAPSTFPPARIEHNIATVARCKCISFLSIGILLLIHFQSHPIRGSKFLCPGTSATAEFSESCHSSCPQPQGIGQPTGCAEFTSLQSSISKAGLQCDQNLLELIPDGSDWQGLWLGIRPLPATHAAGRHEHHTRPAPWARELSERFCCPGRGVGPPRPVLRPFALGK